MKLCDAAAKLDFDEMLKSVTELEAKVAKVADHVMPAAQAAEGEAGLGKIGDAQFESAMRVFVTSAQKQLSSLREQADEVVALSARCLEVYAERAPPSRRHSGSSLCSARIWKKHGDRTSLRRPSGRKQRGGPRRRTPRSVPRPPLKPLRRRRKRLPVQCPWWRRLQRLLPAPLRPYRLTRLGKNQRLRLAPQLPPRRQK